MNHIFFIGQESLEELNARMKRLFGPRAVVERHVGKDVWITVIYPDGKS